MNFLLDSLYVGIQDVAFGFILAVLQVPLDLITEFLSRLLFPSP
jgi:hypothetical protein